MIEGRGLKARVLSLAGKRHLLLRLGSGPPRLAFAAHYDRFPGSPGALDNSAACLALLELASRLASRPGGGPRGLLLLFTDGEEAPAASGPLAQGAYALGRGLSAALRGAAPALLVFDVVGRGERLLVSSAPMELLSRQARDPAFVPGRGGAGGAGAGGADGAGVADGAGARGAARRGRLLASLGALERLALAAAEREGLERPIRLPLPWSDDLGFLLSGLPALTLSLLPRAEAELYSAALAKLRAGQELPLPPERALFGSAWPLTWDSLHGPEDRVELIEGASIELVLRLGLSLAAALG